ncbi:hypothetical protein OG618_28195 [Kitasatospora sp. NBC_01246]|uniref:hypothetical protein n=1 Tax=Kitasatospora sp. NBC_01246 TaxID=2903570 RepID=UPI002E32CBC0|nr:hypothetical protein [Kitasatospora sp. NBC_01246]
MDEGAGRLGVLSGLGRTAGWFGRAVVRYAAVCVVPVYVPLLLFAAFAPNGLDVDGFSQNGSVGYYTVLLMILMCVTVPGLILLLVVAFAAARGRGLRGVVALLLAAPPLLFLLAGAWPFLVLPLLGVVYAGLVMPAPVGPSVAGGR